MVGLTLVRLVCLNHIACASRVIEWKKTMIGPAIHCNEWECKLLFDKCALLLSDADQCPREIVQAAEMQREGSNCVSQPSYPSGARMI